MLRRTNLADVTCTVDVIVVLGITVTFFLVVIECRVTGGELTRAQFTAMQSGWLVQLPTAGHVKCKPRKSRRSET
jgi:hypothetical protein